MAEYADISDAQMPQFVRRCWQRYQEATQKQRDREKESLGFWIGGKHQWREGETAAREGKQLPWLTINRCKPAVDQIENETRNNPPGPLCAPVGGGADDDGADILEGLIREYEYRSDAHSAYVTALRYATAGGSGAFELATDYVSERSIEQQLVVKEIPDPSVLFYDPSAQKPCREDAEWMGKLRVLTEEQVRSEFGNNLKILNKSITSSPAGWMASVGGALGWKGDFYTTNSWTGAGKGPFYIAEFYRVHTSREKLTLYSDSILRFDGEDVPVGVQPKEGPDGKVTFRDVPRRQIWKHVVTALDHIKKTLWPGLAIPIFWVMGPEIWRDGELFRHSLITGAMDSQRGLNYTATSAAIVVGNMTKAPFIGWEGQFDVINAQGFNPWEASNSSNWAFLEVKPVWSTDPVTNQSQLLSAPQRNTWEAPIQRLLELATFFGEQIKAATSVFFDPSQQSVADVQSGKAIQALQSQTNVGTLNWQENLHRAVQLSYNEAIRVLQKIMDGQRVRQIVRPGNKAEVATINKWFPQGEMQGARHLTKDGKLESTNTITLGQYSVRVTAGAFDQTNQAEAIDDVTQALKFMPTLLQNPKAQAQFLRWLGKGDPEIEALAEIVAPDTAGAATPEQLQQQLAQARQEAQGMGVMIQKLYMELKSKVPQIEADKWKTAIEALVKIRVAEITASKDMDRQKADIAASMLEHLTGVAHDVGLQKDQQEHEKGMAATMAANQSAQSAQDSAQNGQLQQQAAESSQEME